MPYTDNMDKTGRRLISGLVIGRRGSFSYAINYAQYGYCNSASMPSSRCLPTGYHGNRVDWTKHTRSRPLKKVSRKLYWATKLQAATVVVSASAAVGCCSTACLRYRMLDLIPRLYCVHELDWRDWVDAWWPPSNNVLDWTQLTFRAVA